MDTRNPENYQVEDFVTDESFSNYHFCLNTIDQSFWEKWVLMHPDKAGMVEEAKNMLTMLSLSLPAKEYKQELEAIKDAINIDQAPVFRLPNWDQAHTTRKRKAKLAAALFVPLALLLIVGGFFFVQRFLVSRDSLATKHNNNNKPLVFTLEDGTVVTLASNSVLEYPGQFKEKERKVYLQGEARFLVTSDRDHPFKVYQDNIIATVLGTDFSVKKQPGDSVISVELLTGKLQVETIASPGSLPQLITLEPNQRAVYVIRNQSLSKEVWKQNDQADSLNDHLVFRQSSFEDIAARIKELFGVTVINQSSKRNWRFTGEFSNTTAKDVMENICLIKKLNLEIRRDTFLIKNAVATK
jgi:ferric-dicitrate binding protein FerR (iron transport regulator)